MTHEGSSVAPLVRFAVLARDRLGEARAEIDALNVYPVPDGDTGTNLFLTFESAAAALQESLQVQGGEQTAELAAAAAAYSRGMLLGARGNSGVIMAQLVGALLTRITEAPAQERAAQVVAEAMRQATDAAYAAVGRPVEGTILSVARAAAQAALSSARSSEARTAGVLAAALAAAQEALARTPEQLPVLREAGVVDAGGHGLCLVLAAAEAAYTGRTRPPASRIRRRPAPFPDHTGHTGHHTGHTDLATGELTEDGPAYEVTYLLDAAAEDIPALRSRLLELGDALVVVGGHRLWNVHVHVDDVGAAVEAGIEAGRPHRVRITHFDGERARERERRRPPGARRAVVALAYADGLAEVFAGAGGTVLRASSGVRPTTSRLLQAILDVDAPEVVVLTNDREAVPAAESAARLAETDHGLRVAVVPTQAQVQGIAALAVHEPERAFELDLVEMTAAARHARSGAVTVAIEEAVTPAGPCRPGDVLGLVEGEVSVVGTALFEVGVQVLDRLLGGGGELVTIVAGADAGELAGQCAEHVRLSRPTVDVLVYDGGQERYPLLFGVE